MTRVELYIYDLQDNLLNSKLIYQYDLFENNTKFKCRIEEELYSLGYKYGRYKYQIQIFDELIGDINYTNTLFIDEISKSRKEIRIAPVPSYNTTYESFLDSLNTIFTGNAIYLKNNRIYNVINSIPDNVTYPISQILKLENELPEEIIVGDNCIVIYRLSDTLTDYINLLPQNQIKTVNVLSAPNFNIRINNQQSVESNYENYNSLSQYSNVFTDYLNMDAISGITLNIDFTDFSNFAFYSNTADRIYNFRYKLSLLESYNSAIDTLENNVNPNVKLSPSYAINIKKWNDKKNDLLSGLDPYEKYLYNTGWPHDTNNELYPINSSQGIQFYNQTLAQCQEYDKYNLGQLNQIIPRFITDTQFIKFINLLGQQFDNVWIYIKHLDYLKDRDEDIETGLSKDLIQHVLQSYGWNIINDNILAELENSSTNLINATTDIIQHKDIKYEIWSRILNNLSHIYKNKGTANGITSLMNCYGIPKSHIQITEFNGYKDNNIGHHTFTRSNYALSFNNTAYVTIPYTKPGTIMFRFRTDTLQNQILFTRADGLTFTLIYTSETKGYIRLTYGSTTIETYEYTLFDNNWHTFIFRHNETTYTTLAANTYDLIVATCKYNKIVLYDSLLYTITDNTVIFDESQSYKIGTTFIGEMQEFRMWNTPISDAVLKQHILYPNNIFNNTIESPYNNLVLRLPFGFDNYTYNHSTTTTTNSKHPNYNNVVSVTYHNFSNTNNYVYLTDDYIAVFPSIGYDIFDNDKVKIDSGSYSRHQLDLHNANIFESSYLGNDRLNISLSTNNEVNFDIAQTINNIDNKDYLGDLSFEDTYSDLDILSNSYYNYYESKYKTFEYQRLVKYYSQSFFNYLNQLVPSRTQLVKGNVIESHILHRNRINLLKQKPIIEINNYEIYLNGEPNLFDGQNTYYDNQIDFIEEDTIGNIIIEYGVLYQYFEPIDISVIYQYSENKNDVIIYQKSETKFQTTF